MNGFYVAPLDECPPTVVLARVAFRLIVYSYKVNPLAFRNPDAGIHLVANLLRLDGFPALADTCLAAAEYCARFKRKLVLWRFDVIRRAGKASARRLEHSRRAYDGGYPRVTNRGVAPPCPWLEDLPESLRPVNESFYEAHR